MLNDEETVGIITSYPAKNGELAIDNAISRYSYLLTKSFSKSQNVVVICEKNKRNSISYHSDKNILVVPAYRLNSLGFFGQILTKVITMNRIRDYLIQFEFSIFGGKKVILSFLLMLLGLKLLNKNVSLTLHQVTTNLNELSGHLGLTKNSLKTKLLNLGLDIFYRLIGILVSKVIVHDDLLKNRLSSYVNSEKIKVIPHAVGDENVKRITPKLLNVAKKDFGFKKNDKIITVYGYRSWYKGTDWIVKTVKELNDANPKSNLKLLVAGGASPTLKDTSSYKSFDRKLKDLIKKASGIVKVTGFVPEKNVWKVFAASDIIVFPYRTRMSSSGAFALTSAYKKPYLVSNHFAVGSSNDLSKNIFELNTFSFEKALDNIKNITLAEPTEDKSWQNIARLYLENVKDVKINFDAFKNFKKVYQLAQS